MVRTGDCANPRRPAFSTRKYIRIEMPEVLAMNAASRLLFLIAVLGLCWEECGGNPIFFCYRIFWNLRGYYSREIFSEGSGHVRNYSAPAAPNL